MEAADMIKEEGLKKGFMLATLISTIAGTFITGINLYDRVVDQRRQHKMDRTQNKKIKELEARLGQAEEEKKRIKEAKEQGRRRSNKSQHSSDDGSSSSSDDDDDGHRRKRDRNLRRSLEYGGTSIQREFDRYMRNIGHQFARGDLVAQTQLQSQIIILQSSVIKLLEEALMTGNPPDVSRLYNTSEFARQGSIRALQDQYQRMIQSSAPAPYPGPVPRRGGPRPGAPIRRTSSTPSLRGSDRGSTYDRQQQQQQQQPRPQRKALPAPPAGGSVVSASSNGGGGGAPLFCRYAEDLQRTAGAPFDLSDRQHCPACRAVLGFSNQSSWRIEKKVRLRGGGGDDRMSKRSTPSRASSTVKGDDDDDDVVTRSFILTPRFVAKCHREGPEGYACYLCNCNRDRDTICRSEEALVNHVASKHGVSEYVHERDIKEMAKTLPYR